MKKNYKIYGENVNKYADRTHIDKLSEEYIRIIHSFLDENDGDILDIGCGSGRDLEYMFQQKNINCNGFGVDAAPGMINYATQNSESDNIQYINSDMKNLPFNSDSIERVWCQATLFMNDRDGILKSLKEISRVLGDFGVCYLSFKIKDGQSSENGIQIRQRWGENIRYYFVDGKLATDLIEEIDMMITRTWNTEFGDSKFLNIRCRSLRE